MPNAADLPRQSIRDYVKSGRVFIAAEADDRMLNQLFELIGDTPPPGFREELLGAPRDALMLEAMLAPRSTVDAIGEFRHQTGIDVDWLARLRESGLRVERIDATIARKRIRAESTGHRDTTENPEDLVRILRDSIDRRRSGSG